MHYAGIDWADRHHDAVVIDETGHRLGATRVAHDAAGLADLVAFLHANAAPDGQVACIVETSQGLLVAALLEAGLTVYPVNPSHCLTGKVTQGELLPHE